ncbi:hypothetical protein HYX19_00790 [Candidatus Woesearchaeota archaeon]|nr:hypothetical protein [Candidatus Woesearchaeota archaeon]
MVSITTIQIKEETKNKLDSLKDYPRESYEEVINKLLEIVAEENMELSEETKRDIEESRKEFKQGKWVSFEEVRKKAGLK